MLRGEHWAASQREARGVLRLRARRGDVGIAPYGKAAGKLYVGADAHIRPCGYVQRIGRRTGRAQKRPPKAALRLPKKPPAFSAA